MEGRHLIRMDIGEAFHAEGVPGTRQGGWEEQGMLGKEEFSLLLRERPGRGQVG